MSDPIFSVHAFAGGAGTIGDPYQITTPAELASLSSYLGSGHSGKYFKLINDINLGVAPYNTGTGWTPIGTSANPFYGKFDGDYKTSEGGQTPNFRDLCGVIMEVGIGKLTYFLLQIQKKNS